MEFERNCQIRGPLVSGGPVVETRTSNAGGMDSIPAKELRSHMLHNGKKKKIKHFSKK